ALACHVGSRPRAPAGAPVGPRPARTDPASSVRAHRVAEPWVRFRAQRKPGARTARPVRWSGPGTAKRRVRWTGARGEAGPGDSRLAPRIRAWIVMAGW